MKIGICDDEVFYQDKIREICENTIGREEYVIFHDGKQLLEYAIHLDLVILDIEMPNMSGIEVKNKLQTLSRDTIIVFVTSHDEYISDAFGLYVYGFVPKYKLEEKLPDILQKIKEILKSDFLIEDKYHSSKILYIQSAHNYGTIFMNNGEHFLLRITMKELENMLLSYDFIRIHREYIVNLRSVESLTTQHTVLIDNGEQLPISKRLYHNVKDAYISFCIRNAR